MARRAAQAPLDPLERSSLWLTDATAPVGTAVACAIAASLMLLRRKPLGVALLAAGVGGAGLAVLGVRALTDIPRPLMDPLGPAAGSAFPSAHAASWAALVTAVWCVAPPSIWRTTWAILGGALVLAIAASRVRLGAHGPLDVLAGIALGVAVTGAASYALSRLGRLGVRADPAKPP